MSPPDSLRLVKHRRGTCAFCGSRGPLTKEDAWPRWLNKQLPPSAPGTALDLSLQGNEVVRASRRTVTSYNTARVAGFCKACNNGWMSELEMRAAPLLLPMIRGQRTSLDPKEQAVVAEWVTKTALVFDQRALGRRPLVSDEVTHEFGRSRAPILGSRILLAHYTGADWVLNHAVSGLPAVYRDGTEKVIVAIVTLCLGELAMQLICPTDLTETRSTSLLRRDDGPFATELDPSATATVQWPPAVGLKSADWFHLGLTEQTSVDVSGILSRIDPTNKSS
jgi:hypothetical protein